MSLKKMLVYLQIALQILSPSSFIYISAMQHGFAQERVTTSGTKKDDNTSDTEQALARTAVQAGTIFKSGSEGAVTSALTSAATSAATAEVQQWLNRFGTARINLSLDKDFSVQDSSVDLLVPLYDDARSNLLFMQLGGRRNDERNIVNAGFGYRHFVNKWMWGTNLFYDRQISANQHQRLGAGAELGWDYLKLSANGYFRLSNWKASQNYQDYNERVANGFDIRANGYLPAWPNLGASVVYEQYYGNSVGLFSNDEDERQKNPHAVTLGLDYTPVPLLTFGVNKKYGKGGHDEFLVNMAMNWTPGVPMGDQLDPSAVAARRTLLGGRHELVARNNNIVLEYRKQELISLSLPSVLSGEEKTSRQIAAKVNAKHGLDHLEWQGDRFFRAGGTIEATSSPNRYTVTLPEWQSSGTNRYILTGTAWDKKGNASSASQMQVEVKGINIATLQSATTASPATLSADGNSTSTVTLTLTRDNGERAVGLASRLSANMQATQANLASSEVRQKAHNLSDFSETSPGTYTTTFTSGTTPGTVLIQPLIDGTVKLATAKIVEEATNRIPALSRLETSATAVAADGIASVTLKALVVDQNGTPLPGQNVHWQADNPQAQLSATDTVSDSQGVATISVTSRAIIDTVITSTLAQGKSLHSPALHFIADASSAQITALTSNKMQVVANSRDSAIVTATVRDASQHPLGGITVNWEIDKTDGISLGKRTSVTDSQGIATTELKSTKVGVVRVTAEVNGQKPQQTGEISFIADMSSEQVSAVTLSKTQAIANGTDTITYEATVSDGQGNPVSGATVNWSADNNSVRLSTAKSISDKKGKTQLTVTSLKTGHVILTAATSDTTPVRAARATFTGDTATAKIQSITSDRASGVANGSDAVKVRATLVDANNNLLSGVDVDWQVSPSSGALSATRSKTSDTGIAEVTLTSRDVASYTVTATVNGSSQSLNNLNFIGDSKTAYLDSLQASSTQALANGSAAITLTAKVIDRSGHPVAGEAIAWRSEHSAAKLSSNRTQTNAQGITQITVTSSDVTDTVIIAQHDGAEALRSDTLHFTVDEASEQVASINSSKTVVVANNTDSAVITAMVKDASQHPVAGVTVNWVIDNSNGGTPGKRTSVTNRQGIATTELKSTRSGSVRVSADVKGQHAKQTESIRFIADQSTQQVSAVAPDKTQAIANGSDGITYKATVSDAQGNPISGATVTWSADNRDVRLSAAQSVSGENGQAQVVVTSRKAGSVILSARISAVSPLQAASTTFIADSATAAVAEVTSDDTRALANGTAKLNISAKVKDTNGNPLANADVRWQVTPHSGSLSAGTTKTDASGVARVTLSSTDVGTYQVTASSNGSTKTVAGLTFTGDNATAHISTLTAGKVTDIVADKDRVTLTALVQDANQHPLPGVTVAWTSSDEANATFTPAASSVTNAQGQATITFSTLKAGNVNVTATANKSSKTQTLNVIGNVDTARIATIEPDKDSAVANNTDSITWSATVTDANNNLLNGVTVTWSKNRDNVTLTPQSSVTDAGGKATTRGSTLKSGAVTVTANTPSGGSKDSRAVNFTSDIHTARPVSMTHSTDHIAASTGSVIYTVTVQDANANPVANSDVAWTTTLNDLSATTTKTDTNGMARVSLSGNDFGKPTVTATLNNTSISDNGVTFMGSVEDNWNIPAKIEYNGAIISKFGSLAFLATGDTTGPTSVIWNGTNGESPLTTRLQNDQDGKFYTVSFGGRRIIPDCSRSLPFNDATRCELPRQYPNLRYSQAYGDNAKLPPGTYRGDITFDGKDWFSSWALHFVIHITLVIQ